MSGLWIWLAAAGTYLAFSAWYENWRGPLKPEEVETLVKRLQAAGFTDAEELTSLRRFLEEDDGREFIMLNLVRVGREPVPHPETGAPTPAREILRGYLDTFLPQLLRRAGHPLLQARKVGGYLDAWNVEADPGWSFMGYMRYRSRRDLAELAATPSVAAGHRFKAAAISNTFSFPTQPMISLYTSPRIWVGLVLALVAALAHLFVLWRSG